MVFKGTTFLGDYKTNYVLQFTWCDVQSNKIVWNFLKAHRYAKLHNCDFFSNYIKILICINNISSYVDCKLDNVKKNTSILWIFGNRYSSIVMEDFYDSEKSYTVACNVIDSFISENSPHTHLDFLYTQFFAPYNAVNQIYDTFMCYYQEISISFTVKFIP